MTTPTGDGRNPQWAAGSVPYELWEAVLEEHDLAAVQIGQLRMVLDGLHEAETLLAESADMADRERIQSLAGARSARKAVNDFLDVLRGVKTSRPGPAPKAGPFHGHRTQRESRARDEAAN